MLASLDHEAPILDQLGNQIGAAGFIVRSTDLRRRMEPRREDGQATDYDLVIGSGPSGSSDVNHLFHTRANGRSLNLFGYSNPKVDATSRGVREGYTDTEAQDAYHDLRAPRPGPAVPLSRKLTPRARGARK
jgi:hypothetical protein